MDAEYVAMIAGIVLSLAFSYVPGLRNQFDGLDEKYGTETGGNYKRLIMLVVLFLTSAGLLGLSCIGRYDGVACDVDGIWQALSVFVQAAIANQAAFMVSPKVRTG